MKKAAHLQRRQGTCTRLGNIHTETLDQHNEQKFLLITATLCTHLIIITITLLIIHINSQINSV